MGERPQGSGRQNRRCDLSSVWPWKCGASVALAATHDHGEEQQPLAEAESLTCRPAEMAAQQGGGCPACLLPEPGVSRVI